MTTLESLFDRFRRRADADALSQVFDALAPELLRLARHLVRDRAAAEDLLQATFLAAIERRESFDAERPLRGWIFGILAREAAAARRERSRLPDPLRVGTARAETEPVDALAARELSDALGAALEQLSPAEREVLVPVLLDGKRAVEVARELGARPDTVHMRVHRGIARLRKLLPAGLGLGVLASLAEARSLARIKHVVLEGARAGLAAGGSASVVSAPPAAAGGLVTTKLLVVSSLLLAAAAFVGLRESGSPERAAATVGALGAPVARTPEAPETDAGSLGAAGGARVAIASAPDPAATTRVELVDADGLPVAGARVAFLGHDGVRRAAETDERGACTLPRAGAVDLHVLREGALLVRARADLSTPAATVALAREAEVSGTVALADGSSPQGLLISLFSASAPPAARDADPRLVEAFGRNPDDAGEACVRLDAAGRFRFRGVHPDWSGILHLPSGTRLREEGPRDRKSELVLRAPATGLRLVLEPRPAIRGRVVDAVTGAPIAGAHGTALLEREHGSMDPWWEADEEGRFRLPLDELQKTVSLHFALVRGRDGRPYVAAPIPLADKVGDGGADLGDVACEPLAVRALRVRVVDGEEQPVPGASLIAEGGSATTADETGVAQLAYVPIDCAELRVGARGFAIEALDPRALGGGETIVRLRPTNRVVVGLADGELAPSTRLRFALVSDVPLFGREGSRDPDRVLARVGAGEHELGFEGAGSRIETRFRAGKDGRVEVDELRSDVAFEVRVLDPFGRTIDAVACPPLGETERREVRLRLPETLRPIVGLVVDADGHPLDGARIVCTGDDRRFNVVAGPDGRFRVDHVVGDDFGLVVSKRGYTNAAVAGSAFPSDGSELVIRLHRAHDLRVVLVDPDGAPVRGARVSVAHAGGGGRLAEQAPGEFAQRDLPETTLRLTVEVGGARYERDHPSSEPLARFELPRHGSVEVVWPADLPSDERRAYQVALRPVDAARTPLVVSIARFPSPGGASFASVLPGTWTVAIEAAAREGTERAGALEAVDAPVCPLRTIEVREGEATRVELAR